MFKDMTDEEKKKYWIEHNKRSRNLRKLKNEVAQFVTLLQSRRGANMNEKAMLLVNMELREVYPLKPGWKNKDLERARKTIDKLSRKYLNQPFYKIPNDKATVMTECLGVLDKTKLDTQARVDVLYELLRLEAEKLYLHEGDAQDPTAHNALLFLTQDLKDTVPAWFNKALFNLIKEKYGNRDYRQVMKDLRTALQTDFMDRNVAQRMQAAIDEESRGDANV